MYMSYTGRLCRLIQSQLLIKYHTSENSFIISYLICTYYKILASLFSLGKSKMYRHRLNTMCFIYVSITI